MSSGGPISQVPVYLSFSHSYNTTALWSFKAVYIISYSFPISPEPFPYFQLRCFCVVVLFSIQVCLLSYWLYCPFQYHQVKFQPQINLSLSSKTKHYSESNPPTLTDECFYIFSVYIGWSWQSYKVYFLFPYTILKIFPFLLKHFSHTVPILFLADVFP